MSANFLKYSLKCESGFKSLVSQQLFGTWSILFIFKNSPCCPWCEFW